MGRKRVLGTACGVLVAAMAAGGCGDGGDSGSDVRMATLTLRFDPFGPGAKKADAELTEAATDAVTASLCVRRLRIKADDPGTGAETTPEQDDADADNIELPVGAVPAAPEGTELGIITLREGTYRRIEVDLDPGAPGSPCTGGYSIRLTNAAGTFETTERLKLRYFGEFPAIGSKVTLGLSLTTVLASLAEVRTSQDIVRAVTELDAE